MPLPDFSSYRISSYADVDFDANDKQNCIVIGWYQISLDEHFIYFCYSSQIKLIKGGISRWSALVIMEVRSSPKFSETLRDDYFDFNAYFFEILFIHIFGANLVSKSEVLQIY